MNKDIIFLCQFFYPETVSSATLPFDTAKHLAAKGYRVGALCGYPKEYSVDQDTPLTETADNVEIRRLKYLQLSRKGSLGRLINYFSFTLKVWLNAGKLKNCRCTVVYSNPPVLPLAAIRAKKKYGTKLVFVAYDIYPEIAYVSGSIRKGSLLDRVMGWVNERLYRYADAVVALTDEMKQYLLSVRPQLTRDRVVTIQNWSHEKAAPPLAEDTARKFGFSKEQFVVGYFGNMGTCQDIDTLLQTAKRMKEDNGVGFLIVGHGNKKEMAREFIAENGLTNVKVYDYLVGEAFEQAVALVNCTVVSLALGLKGTCAPSKYYSCLLGGHPVIAIVEEDSYLAQEISNKKIGYHVKNGDAEGFMDAICALRADRSALAEMGARAQRLYHENYDYPIAMKKYEALLEKIL